MTPINIGAAAALTVHPIDNLRSDARDRLEAEVNARSGIGVTSDVVGVNRQCSGCSFKHIMMYHAPIRLQSLAPIECVGCGGRMSAIECIEYPCTATYGWIARSTL